MQLKLTLLNDEIIEYSMEQESMIIGRSSKCDLVIPHESMSRQHCQIQVKDGEIFITDMGSINGVYIDGKKIEPNVSVPFQTYLHLAFGYVANAHFSLDERPLAAKPKNFGISASSSQLQNQGTKSKTKTLQTQKVEPTSSKPKAKAKQSSSSGKNALLINALAFFTVLAAVYYFLYADKEPDYSTDPESTESLPAE